MTAINKPSTIEIEKLMQEITNLEYRDIAHEILVTAQTWKVGNITEDRFFYEIRRSIQAGINRRHLMDKPFPIQLRKNILI